MAKAKAEPTNADYAKMLTPLLAGTPMPAYAGPAKKPSPGVLPNGKASEPLRKMMLDEGYVESHLRSEVDVMGKKPKLLTVEDFKLTSKGKDFVLRELGGRELLEPLPGMVEATATAMKSQMTHLESKIVALHDLISEITSLQTKLAESVGESITGLQQVISHAATRQVTVKIEAMGASSPNVEKFLIDFVQNYRSANGNYCPFDELYEHLYATFPALTIGWFHDILRKLNKDRIVEVSAYTQGINGIKNSEYVFMISNRPMYYASIPS